MQTLLDAFGRLASPDGELLQIIWTTLQMSFASTFISCIIGMPLGVLLGSRNFRSKRFFLRLTHTLMGLPPVVAGLVVFMILSRKGPLGSMGLLFSVPAMIIAQVVLITPIVVGLTASHVSARGPLMLETARGMGIRAYVSWGVLYDARPAGVVLLMGFGRLPRWARGIWSEGTYSSKRGDDDGHLWRHQGKTSSLPSRGNNLLLRAFSAIPSRTACKRPS